VGGGARWDQRGTEVDLSPSVPCSFYSPHKHTYSQTPLRTGTNPSPEAGLRRPGHPSTNTAAEEER